MPQSPSQARSVRFGSFEANLFSHELRKHGVRVRLPGQPFDILRILLERSGEVVTREELRQRLWPADTFVDFENGMNNAVKKLRAALSDSADHPLYIETLPRVGYRFIAPLDQTTGTPSQAPERLRIRWKVIVPISIVVVALVIGSYFYLRRTPKLAEDDSIVLADFANSTGDPVFDGTLRQGLSVQLEQSPFLSIVSDQQIQQTLRMMGQKPDAKLTPEIAQEICQRTGSAAVLDGSIVQIGAPYLLTVKAINCSNGETLVSTDSQASDKSHVLDALGKTAAQMRSKLGESLSTVQKFDTPLEQATTPSLEALHAYNLGRKASSETDWAASVPFFQQAVQLDPNFAMAYARLGNSYNNILETNLGALNTQKAYQLRERVSEHERLYIESHYYQDDTGDLEKARRVYELWAQSYPREYLATANLSYIDNALGQYDKALEEARETLRLNANGTSYLLLVGSFLNLNRLEEARATAEEAQARRFDSSFLHFDLYQLAFLQNDRAGMAQQVAWSVGKPGNAEDALLDFEAKTAAYSGKVEEAREFSRRAAAVAERGERTELAALENADDALQGALFGNAHEARQRAAAALGLSNARGVQFEAALALAFIGDAARAQTLVDDLSKRFREDTIVRFNLGPTLRAQLALNRKDSSTAIEILQVATQYELGSPGQFDVLYPVYVRGQAYLAAHQGREAAGEFQKILEHRGVVGVEPIGALAHLQIGKAYAMQGDTAKAKTAYQDFLTLWKDADPDIPILKQAKAEYAKLQ